MTAEFFVLADFVVPCFWLFFEELEFIALFVSFLEEEFLEELSEEELDFFAVCVFEPEVVFEVL